MKEVIRFLYLFARVHMEIMSKRANNEPSQNRGNVQLIYLPTLTLGELPINVPLG